MHERTRAILCLCDDVTMLQVRKLVLEHFGYKVWSTDSVEDARNIAKTSCPDMILMDNSFPATDLEGIAEQIKKVCPSVIAVALAPYFSVRSAENGSVDHFVARDQSPDTLIATIRQLFEQRPEGAINGPSHSTS